MAWRGVALGFCANLANPRGVAIRAELEWCGVGALREFGIAWIDAEFQNYNSGNSNSKVIPVALEWRGGIGLGPLRRGVGHATPGPHVALAGIGITIPVGSE